MTMLKTSRRAVIAASLTVFGLGLAGNQAVAQTTLLNVGKWGKWGQFHFP